MFRDFKFIFKTPLLMISLIVVATLPFLYAVTFLGAMWDPYENTEEMKFNIVNEDKGEEDINVGDSLIDELKKNNRLDWQFTDLDTAKKALQKGDSYGYIVIPKDASKKSMTFLTEHPEKVEMELNTNPGHNFIGALMSEQVGTYIIDEVRTEITDKYITTIIDQLDSVETDSEDAQNAITQLSQGAADLDEGIGEAQQSSGELEDGASQLNSGASELNNGAKELNSGAAQLYQGEQAMTGQIAQVAPMFGEQGQQLIGAQSQLETSAGQLSEGTSGLTGGASELTDGSAQLSDGLNQLNGGLRELKSGSEQLSNSLSQIETQFQEVLDRVDEENLSFTEKGANDIAQPVNLEINELINTQNYGQSFAPLIIAISLFVGSITFNVVYPMNKKFEDGAGVFQSWISRMLLFIAHAVIISTLIVIMLDFGMQIDVGSHWRFYLLSFMWSLLSITIIGALVMTFGNFGKFLSIVLLILQLSASAGTFPIETANHIYQKMYEFLPMSYTVIGYRDAIFNQAFDHEFSTVIYVLLAMFVGFALIILLLFWLKDLFPKYRDLTNKMSRMES